ncbi:MAG: spore coat protein U domain-containing protein [Acidobacteria bacterium]|nr:spore coat protein U domain-containing protein [Acidobacteriota bacterium]
MVTCTQSEDYRVYMSQGQNHSMLSRRMEHDTQSDVFLEYDIYLEEEHTTRWGSEFGINDHSGTGTGESQTITIYGLIPLGQTPSNVGNFADTVVVYLEW